MGNKRMRYPRNVRDQAIRNARPSGRKLAAGTDEGRAFPFQGIRTGGSETQARERDLRSAATFYLRRDQSHSPSAMVVRAESMMPQLQRVHHRDNFLCLHSAQGVDVSRSRDVDYVRFSHQESARDTENR